jgi:hypothetical protein
MTEEEKEELLQRAVAECLIGSNIDMPLSLNLHSALAIVGALQLALRHPAVAGTQSSVPVRKLIDAVIAATETNGYLAAAEMMRLGDHPEHDRKYVLSQDGLAIKCLSCGRVSHNPHDVQNRYCGHCHKFLEDGHPT